MLNKIGKGQFISIYDETEESGNFHVCRFISKDDRNALFQAISIRGYSDGYYLIPLDSIYRIDIEDEYTKRIEKLFNLQNQQFLDELPLCNESLLIDLLYHSKQNELISSVFLDDEETVTGCILEIDQERNCICLQKLNDSGVQDGITYIDIEVIEKMICDSGVERCIGMLMDQ